MEDPNETKDQMQEPQDTEKMSKQEESLPLNQPEEAVNILEEPETLHGTESEDVFHSDKPHVDSTLESVDSPINNARDFIAGNFPGNFARLQCEPMHVYRNTRCTF